MKKRFLPHKQAGAIKKIAFWLGTIIVGLGFLCVIFVGALFVYFSIGLPDIKNLENLAEAQSTEIFDREGNLLYTIHGEENREHVSYDNISEHLKNATIAIEDDQYWEHKGYDIWGIGKGLLNQVFGMGRGRGGSTITQQYIKNTFLSSERTYTRKAKELILAIRLEKSYSKEKILELYLNRIPYGNNAYGIQKAAEIYYGKDAKDLNLAESVILASLPQAPSKYNPFGDNRYSHLLKEFTEDELKKRPIVSEFDLELDEYVRGLIGANIELLDGSSVYIPGRTDIALNRLEAVGQITSDEKKTAKETLQNIEFNNYRQSMTHPHFVIYIKQILENNYGKDRVEQGGLKVYTTIDPNIQQAAEKFADENGEGYITRFDADNIAAFTINAKTGEILAMLGSRDYWNEEIDGNVNVVLRPRQPGSSFKPFVYAQAFYNGYAPGSVVHDIPTRMGADKPENYDGKFQGQITLRRALAQSRNIPAIKAYYLADQQNDIIDLVEKMGITTLDKNHSYGYPLVLGAGEVPLYEMVQAYSVFANNGKKPEITGIIRIENSNGDIIEEWNPEEFEEVLDPQVAYLVNDILSDVDQSVGPRLFVSGRENAAKTGTSTKETKSKSGSAVKPSDAWTIGYTPTIVTGVWVGNSDGRGLDFSANGYDAAAPVFNAIMTEALKNDGAEPFPEPEGIRHIEISKASGKLPSGNTPKSMITTEIFPSFSVPTEEEQVFFKVELDKVSGLLATEYTPEDAREEITFQNYEPIAEMLNWKAEVKKYYQGKTGSENGVRVGLPPTEYDNVHTAESQGSKPVVHIVSPASQSRISQGGFKVNISLDAPNGIDQVEYYINDKLEYFTSTYPYTGHLNISKFMQKGSRQLIVAKVVDKLGYSTQSAIEIKVARDEDDEKILENETKEEEEEEDKTTDEEETIPAEEDDEDEIVEEDTTPDPEEETSVFDTTHLDNN